MLPMECPKHTRASWNVVVGGTLWVNRQVWHWTMTIHNAGQTHNQTATSMTLEVMIIVIIWWCNITLNWMLDLQSWWVSVWKLWALRHLQQQHQRHQEKRTFNNGQPVHRTWWLRHKHTKMPDIRCHASSAKPWLVGSSSRYVHRFRENHSLRLLDRM